MDSRKCTPPLLGRFKSCLDSHLNFGGTMKPFLYRPKGTFLYLFLANFFCFNGAHAADSDSKLEIYGFAQADYIQDFKRVNPAWDDTLRPSRIPTQPGQFGSDGQAIIGARQ